MIFPYFSKQEIGAYARYAIIRVSKGRSMLPLLNGPGGLIPLTEEYELCSHEDAAELMEYHEKRQLKFLAC